MPPTSRPVPVDADVPFGIEELFFSATDRKGRILEGNDVFQRVSGMPRDVLIGSPHNVVRHPDTPRAIFRLLWQRLQQGLPIAAYVKNISADGRFYWVMAVAVATPDGYLSVRLKPVSPEFGAVPALYARVRDVERAHEAEGADVREVATAGLEALMAELGAAGFADYSAFERAVLPAEIRARAAALAGSASVRSHVPAIADMSDTLDALFTQVEEYQQAGAELDATSGTVRGLAVGVRLNALNGLVAAHRLSSDGATLAVVADRMTGSAHDIMGLVSSLDAELAPTIEALGALAFRISTAKLQVDMAAAYAAEADAHDDDHARSVLGLVVGCAADSAREVATLNDELRERLARVAAAVSAIEGSLDTLGALHMRGRIEVAGVRDSAASGCSSTTSRNSSTREPPRRRSWARPPPVATAWAARAASSSPARRRWRTRWSSPPETVWAA